MDPFGRKRIEEQANLIAHLKNDKRAIRKNLRTILDQEASATIEFMTRDEELNQNPYMFVNSKGRILGCTHALKVALGITEDVEGKHYLDVFNFPNGSQKTKDSLREYFSSQKKISIPYERKKGRKTIKLTITKEEPVYTEPIEIESRKSTRTFRGIAFVPIKVGPRKRKRIRLPGMSPEDIKVRETQLSDITVNLIINYGWGVQQIDEYITEHGQLGLLNEYERLEKKAK